ncbi:DNA polymerase III subunit delta [Bryobacter aggregatus]|uniref:DNA polymerase III subunit delta n=1 Tax=Bryobacter aggregatus TaxID=360054 RepID=UPI0004E0DACD|nr:DNA polymerase III subunit delta [Bryobacter aggregatus]
MTAEQFVTGLAKQKPPAVCLFVGPDAYMRNLAKEALLTVVLPTPADRESGWSRWDLTDVSVAQVLDDAASMSLFASRRLVWVAGAEAVVPKGRAKQDDESHGAKELQAYLNNPTPDTTIVFDCSRYDFDGDDKTKVENLRKFFAPVKAQVEFPRFTPDSARRLALELAAERKIRLGASEVALLVEATGADASRISHEVEKLALYAKPDETITADTITALVPNARAANIFALVGSIGRGDRAKSLDILDTLIREGEYLPVSLAFLSTQFRLALAAHESRVKGAVAIQGHFSKLGTPMWRARAEQVEETMSAFGPSRLKKAIRLVYAADQALRDTRPDDKTVMEDFVWKVTAKEALKEG